MSYEKVKICRECSKTSPEVSFYPNRRLCKSCYAQQGYKWRDENKEIWLDIVRHSKKRNYDHNRHLVSKRNRKWREANVEYIKEQYKHYRKTHPDVFAKQRKLRTQSLKQQTPSWADHQKIREIYVEAREKKLEVDHIIPLQGKCVSGLHVENNLQLLSRAENRKKSNHYECDHPVDRH